MTQTDTQAHCSAQAYHGQGGGWYACSRKAKLERDGKSYCTQHDPERVAAKNAEKRARWKTEDAARQKTSRRRAAETYACEGISTEALEAGVVAEMLEALEFANTDNVDLYLAVAKIKAVIAKAKA